MNELWWVFASPRTPVLTYTPSQSSVNTFFLPLQLSHLGKFMWQVRYIQYYIMHACSLCRVNKILMFNTSCYGVQSNWLRSVAMEGQAEACLHNACEEYYGNYCTDQRPAWPRPWLCAYPSSRHHNHDTICDPNTTSSLIDQSCQHLILYKWSRATF